MGGDGWGDGGTDTKIIPRELILKVRMSLPRGMFPKREPLHPHPTQRGTQAQHTAQGSSERESMEGGSTQQPVDLDEVSQVRPKGSGATDTSGGEGR